MSVTKIALAGLVFFSASVAFAGDDQIVLKVATVAPTDTPWSALMDRVKKRIKKESNGRMKMKIYYGGRLGGEKETARETREGRVHMWGGSTAAMATIVPELYALEAPFLFDSSEEADFVLDNYARPHVAKLLEDRGFILYQFAENGWHGLATKGDCVKSMSDLKGKKIRSQEAKIHLDMFKAMGANPVEMAVPEVLPSLKQGVVDGFSNTPLFSFAVSWYQGIDAFTVTDHIYQPAVVVYSKKWFKKQPKDIQAMLLSNFESDQKFGREGVRMLKDGLLKNFEKAGKKVCVASPELKAELRKATSKIFDQYRRKYGKRASKLFNAISEGKKAWAKQKG